MSQMAPGFPKLSETGLMYVIARLLSAHSIAMVKVLVRWKERFKTAVAAIERLLGR